MPLLWTLRVPLRQKLVIGLPGGGGLTFQCGGSAIAIMPAVCSNEWLRTDLDSLLEYSEELLREAFGPATLVVTYADERRLLEAAGVLHGQLTVTVHGEEGDPMAPALLALGASVAGRVIWNGWPTGVAVTHAMTHGGPYPATTAPLHTSVGSTAIRRFLRPVTYQSVPQPLLPPELRDGNPLAVPRSVDGGLPSE
jgi:NADP-dependent aldehyde dehydrogenase